LNDVIAASIGWNDVTMRTPPILVATAMIVSAPVTAFAQAPATDGSPTAIRTVISGKKCAGKDILKFGKSKPGSVGRFKRVGQPAGTYAIGYGTILVRRSHHLRGYVASVSVPRHLLYLSTEIYRCTR
jgi:hypothetical protein